MLCCASKLGQFLVKLRGVSNLLDSIRSQMASTGEYGLTNPAASRSACHQMPERSDDLMGDLGGQTMFSWRGGGGGEEGGGTT